MLVDVKQLLSQMTKASSGIVARIISRDKPLYRRPWVWAGLGIVICTGAGVIAFNYGIKSIDRTLPSKAQLRAMAREQTLTIKAADGKILEQEGAATRQRLKLAQIPIILRKAFIASEDRRFEQHNGVDLQGIVRAFFQNLRSQNVVEGGSTITQQVARILFLNQERTIWRKLKEVRLAQEMERELTKDQILERYLNLVYLGDGAYGVADASWVYFSKSVDQLTLPEMATIAGLAPAPSLWAPDKNPQAAIARRNLVLQRMEEDGVITEDQRQAATQTKLIVKSSPPQRLNVEAPYFTTYILKELPQYVPAAVLKEGGLVVETTLNPGWQHIAEVAVIRMLKHQGREENFKQGALVAINPRNGEIQAMVGGKDFGKNQFNRVTQAKRQPGSTFKGFVYATAIASGKSPYDTYIDEPFVVDGYEPKNFSKNFHGSISMLEALTHSVNIVAVKVLIDVGFRPVIKLAHDMGIQSELKPTYSLALGSNEVTLLELTSAYGSFATQGLHTEAHGIRRILDRQGDVVWSAKYQPRRALDPESAAIMTWMLRNVVENGTGVAAQLDNRPVAGKTGTTDDARDLWFVGYIPQLVAGVWLGNDNNTPTSGSSSSAAETWHNFMVKVVKGMPVEKFPPRPKLEGRHRTIKAKPIKPRKLVSLPVDEGNDSDNSESPRKYSQQVNGDDSESPRKYKRHHHHSESQEQAEETPRHRQHHHEDTSTGEEQHHHEGTSTGEEQHHHEGTSTGEEQHHHEGTSTGEEQHHHEGTSTGKEGHHPPIHSQPETPQPSWRERLRPNESTSK